MEHAPLAPPQPGTEVMKNTLIQGPDGHLFSINTPFPKPAENTALATADVLPLPTPETPLYSTEVAPTPVVASTEAVEDTADVLSHPVAVGALAVGALGAAVAYRKSGWLNRKLEAHHTKKANNLERDAQERKDRNSSSFEARAAQANIDSTLPDHLRNSTKTARPGSGSRLDGIISQSPNLAPLRRAGVVDPNTGDIVGGTAFHYHRRNASSFSEARRVTSQKEVENGVNPTGSPYRSDKQRRRIVAINDIRERAIRAHNEAQSHISWGPYGEVLLDPKAVEDYIARTPMSAQQAADIRKTGAHVRHELDEARELNEELEHIAHGKDDKYHELKRKAGKHQAKAQKHHNRT